MKRVGETGREKEGEIKKKRERGSEKQGVEIEGEKERYIDSTM